MDSRSAEVAPSDLYVSPARVAAAMSAVVVFLLLMHAAVMYAKIILGHRRLYGLVRMFDVLAEANVPTWYSSMMLLGCAALLGVIARIKAVQGDPFKLHWLGLALLFVFLSMDEAAMVHETLQWALTSDVERSDAYFSLANIVFTSLLAVVVLLVSFRFVRALPRRTGVLFVSAGALFLGGGIGVDYVGEVIRNMHDGGETLIYAIVNGAEEALEMAGIVVFAYALLDYLKVDSDGVKFMLTGRR
jgi:hypothetical protein